MNFVFKKKHSLEKRKSESSKIRKKYDDRIPVIVELAIKDKKTHTLDKSKYLVPNELSVGQFIYVIRKRMSVLPEQAIFVFVNNTLPPTSQMMSTIYNEHVDDDGFLYVIVSLENTFG